MLYIHILSLPCVLRCSRAAASWTQEDGAPNLRAILTNTSIKWSSNTKISFPGDGDFINATTRWTVFRPPTYQAAVSPATEPDVSTAIRVASENSIPFLGTGGRHGYGTTLGNLQGGLALDLSKLNSVSVDKDAGTLTVGPGVHFGDVLDPVFNAGYMLPTGSCSCVGILGATVGAGIGRLSGLYGLLLDQLISARVVTAVGQMVTVSNDTNPDLFWGIRGAGANLGLLTSATFQLSPLVNNGDFSSYDMIFPAAKNGSYFDVLASFNDGSSAFPAKLSAASAISYNSTTGEILANWAYVGSQDEADLIIKPVLDLDPSYIDRRVISWPRFTAEAQFGLDAALCEVNKTNDIYGINTKNLDTATFTSIFKQVGDYYAQWPDGQGTTITLEAFPNQASLAVPEDATAYPWRDAQYNILLQFTWEASGNTVEEPSTRLAQSIREQIASSSGYGGLTVYVNYAHGDEQIEEIYGRDKLSRLVELKRAWDSNNAFSFNNPLPT
ncbi:Uu.00g133600.m01.CDS01 [Anthostomella pinea]|uniref:Uu.00g133600.m01.CDS01 n=1 Tax=Anthostomella pinea TaxID=933095 RepID=A0AAI8VNS2_9PEZI|nr:Uu.00g133600.m01.CDS01 [Anthostomella pinea]